MSRDDRDLKNFDPWTFMDGKLDETKEICFNCKKEIGKEKHIYRQVYKNGKPSGKMVFFHLRCYKEGDEYLKPKEKGLHEKLDPDDYDDW